MALFILFKCKTLAGGLVPGSSVTQEGQKAWEDGYYHIESQPELV